jgi:2-dehydro-3-deoxyphosphogluconate aldolase/(4S)-4-hydroxy-2-oxoglutarate aldolase
LSLIYVSNAKVKRADGNDEHKEQGMRELLEKRVVPVIALDDVDSALPLAGAIQAGGLPVLEITLRTPAALEAIRRIAQEVDNVRVGAGTVLEPGQVKAASEAGASFLVAPGLNPEVVKAAQDLGLPVFPGVATPSEVEQALALGCTHLKFFPAEQMGGVNMLKAMAGPYAHTGVRFIPLGGVNAANMAGYLALPVVAAIGGSWLASKALIAEKNWDAITERTREALAIAAGA